MFTVIESQRHMGYKDVITKGYKLLAFIIILENDLLLVFWGAGFKLFFQIVLEGI